LVTETKIDLWFWHLDATVGDIARWRKHLASDELERMSRFMFSKDQERYTICKSRVRRILGWYLGISPRDVMFATTGRDKPVLADRAAGIAFNLTHTDRLACLAVTRGEAVGVDLERVREVKDDFIAYALNPDEHARVLSLDPDARRHAFFRYWTAKEAYLKATGTGLWQLLKTFDVEVPVISTLGELTRGALPRVDDPSERDRNWHLYTFQATPAHIGALALAPPTNAEIRICSRWISSQAWV